jgi:hypothetical protein
MPWRSGTTGRHEGTSKCCASCRFTRGVSGMVGQTFRSSCQRIEPGDLASWQQLFREDDQDFLVRHLGGDCPKALQTRSTIKSISKFLGGSEPGRTFDSHPRTAEAITEPVSRDLLGRGLQPLLVLRVGQIGDCLQPDGHIEDRPGAVRVGDHAAGSDWRSEEGLRFEESDGMVFGKVEDLAARRIQARSTKPAGDGSRMAGGERGGKKVRLKCPIPSPAFRA